MCVWFPKQDAALPLPLQLPPMPFDTLALAPTVSFDALAFAQPPDLLSLEADLRSVRTGAGARASCGVRDV